MGKTVPLGPLMDALTDVRATAGEVRLVYRFAREFQCETRAISHAELTDLSLTDSTTLQIAIRRAEADGFLVVDRTTSPHTYRIADAYCVEA